MTRFFFDYTSDDGVIFDYTGSEFKGPQGALDFAQETLQLLKNSLTREWAGWSIRVCNPQGVRLCSLPIDGPEIVPLAGHEGPMMSA
jgi:hypothetical protein